MFPEVIKQDTPYKSPRPPHGKARDIVGVVLHHTGGSTMVYPHSQGSWHYLIDRDGKIYNPISPDDLAWHAANTDRWKPAWVKRGADWAYVSEVNSCTIGIDLVSPAGSVGFTDQQYESLQALAAAVGPDVWWVGHGEIQLDRRRTEPDNLDWERAGFGPHDPNNGRKFQGMPLNHEEMQLILSLREVGYPAVEAEALIKLFSGLGANAQSVEGWINKIGALEQQLKEKGDGGDAVSSG